MQNCGEMVELREREGILSTFAQKLINSGHTAKSSKIIIVQGVTKYLDNMRRHNLPVQNSEYKPMYLSKEYDQENRQIEKYMGKMTWYQNDGKKEVGGNGR